jgi:hypothetical protein
MTLSTLASAGRSLGQASTYEVTVGHDANETFTVDDGQRADAGLLHDRRGVVDRPLRPDPHA